MTTFIPTHRTTSAIGNIKAGSLIRVAQYNDIGFFSHVLGDLGVKDDAIEYNYPYGDEDVQFWDPSVLGSTTRLVLPGDYIITDGEHFEVSLTGYGWRPLSGKEIPSTQTLDLTHNGHGEYYISFNNEDPIATVTASELHKLSKFIQDTVPKPSPIEDAQFIRARTKGLGEFRTLAKIDDLWYDHNGNEYTEDQVLDIFDEIEVIR